MNQEGKLIVLEGIDGSGKSTQMEKLCQRLQTEGYSYRNLVFPQYEKPSSALIHMYLKGEFGQDPAEVNAFAASTFYAVDRYASYKKDWQEDYFNGMLMVADRYTTSNAVHQTVKLPVLEREFFTEWLFDFEYNKMALPAPNLVIYLDLPVEVSARLIQVEQMTDIHEADLSYLRQCRSFVGNCEAIWLDRNFSS